MHNKSKDAGHHRTINHLHQLAGKTVQNVAYAPAEGYSEALYGMEFTDGTIAWILCDPEGNGPGHLDIVKAGAK